MKMRAYPKGELAQMYYPWCSLRHARRCFHRDIMHSAPLREALTAAGWDPARRVFGAHLVRLVVTHLGEP